MNTLQSVLDTMELYLLGKKTQIEYAVTCLLAGGHLLIEDVPGVGKTTLAKSLAACVDGLFKRVQFTSDLLPSDLVGVTVYHQATAQFEFQPGPVFTNVLLADEINRANPKTQSALLEAMHDAQISHDGITEALPDPFFVVATQNSQDHHGTFPLPESQLDRFLMKIQLGYPDSALEKRVLSGNYERNFAGTGKVDLPTLKNLQEQAQAIHLSDELLDYIWRIMSASRNHPALKVGVSPRGGQGLYKASQALALVRNRNFVIPDDIKELVPLVFPHRVLLKSNVATRDDANPAASVFNEILSREKAPV